MKGLLQDCFIKNLKYFQVDVLYIELQKENVTMKILVIGNGFDLAHGLPTRYTDFLDVVESFISITNSPHIMANGGLNNVAKPKNQFLDRLIFEESTLCLEFKKMVQNNFWIEYFTKCETYAKENWIDFESEISRIIQLLDDIKVLTENGDNVWSIADNRTTIIKNVLNVSKKKLEDVFSDLEKINEFVVVLDKDLKRLIRALEIYLCEYVEKINCAVISSDISNIHFDKILSFNYTDIYTRLYDPKEELDYDYIHGKANLENSMESNNMVLGIDEYLSDDRKNKDTSFITFKKYYQRIHKETGCKYKDWVDDINEDATYFSDKNKVVLNKLTSGKNDGRYESYKKYTHKVFIFGHSLDVTDSDIMRDLILNDNVYTTIYYLNKDVMGQQIANLVKVIGQDELIRRTGGNTKTIEFKLQQDMLERK